MSYIGSTPTTQSFIAGTDYFNGTGSQTAFTLSRSVVSVNDIEVVINNVEQQPNTAYTVSGTTITFTSAPSAGTANIYVRYLSTTTQSITPSQGTVSYSTLNADNQSKLGISFKNRIINGAMVINQRGWSGSIPANTTYTLDRWVSVNSQNNKFTVSQNAGSVTTPAGFVNYLGCTSSSAYTVGSGEIFTMKQVIEGYNIADLGWGTSSAKTVTLSFWVYSSLTGTFGGALVNSDSTRSYPYSYTISSANTWEQKTITIAGDTTGTWLTTNGQGINLHFSLGTGSTLSGTAGTWAATGYYSATGATSVLGTNGATFYITGVQLEVGTQATTFDYRSFGTELILCQRYYQQIGAATTNNVASGGYSTIAPYVMYTASTSVNGAVLLITEMRATPSVSYIAPLAISTGAASYPITSIGITTVQSDNRYVSVNFTASGGGVPANVPLRLEQNGTTAGALLISAEL